MFHGIRLPCVCVSWSPEPSRAVVVAVSQRSRNRFSSEAQRSLVKPRFRSLTVQKYGLFLSVQWIEKIPSLIISDYLRSSLISSVFARRSNKKAFVLVFFKGIHYLCSRNSWNP